MRWFDKWLKDRDTGIDTEPAVRVFTMGVNRWDTFSDWPPKEATLTRYYLHSNGRAATVSGDGALSTDEPGAERPDNFVYDPLNPCPTVGGALFPYPLEVPPGPFDQEKVERRPDVLCYSTPPLERDIQVTGTIEVTLWVASSAVDTDFTAKLVDVFPDGTAINLTDGIIRARYRDGFERGEPLQPGVPAQLTLDLAGTSNVFERGHRIRLEVSSSNFPRFDRNTNTGANIATDPEVVVATNTVFHDAARPSYITLPVVGEA
jgi:putative CocE/NonD family hydrolase